MRRVLRAKIPADLLDKIYKNESWVKIEGESRVKRSKTKYDFSVKGDYMIATKKDK